ncbi:putative leader peptide [Actinokineospora sp. 24-640]
MRSFRVIALTERLHVDLRRQASSLCPR